MNSQQYGVDVSHYQAPNAPGGIRWSALAASGCSFAMVRATYGTSRDPSAAQHVAQARAAGIAVGLYHFFRFSQSITDQLAAFGSVALACAIRVGDIAPAIDIEDDGGPVLPSWSDSACVLAQGMTANFGDCTIYITQRGFGELGKPAWVLERGLWVAHYTGAPAPATPGNADWDMWQHRVGPWAFQGPGGAYAPDGSPARRGVAPGPLDQSRAKRLRLCTRVPGATGSAPPPATPGAPANQPETWQARLDALTVSAYEGLDLNTGKDA